LKSPAVAKFIEDLRRQLQGRADLSALIERRFIAKVKAAETSGLQITTDALQAIRSQVFDELERGRVLNSLGPVVRRRLTRFLRNDKP